MNDPVTSSTAVVRASPWLALVAVGVLYAASVLPFPWPGDSAEFVTVAATLGVAHPTGYPLYAVLGHTMVRALPWCSPAAVMNTASALFLVGGLALLIIVLRRLDVASSVTAVTILVVGTTPTLWENASYAEIYTLHLLIAALLGLAVVDAEGSDRWWRPHLPWFLAGLSMANHMTSGLYFAGLLVWELGQQRGLAWRTRLARLGRAAGAAAIGASAIALLFLLDRPDALNYIEQYARELPHPRFADPVQRILWLETGAQYNAIPGVIKAVLSLDIGRLLLRLTARLLQHAPVLVVGGAIGLVLAVLVPLRLRLRPGLPRFLALSVLLNALYFAGYSRSFFEPAFFAVGFLFLGIGLAIALDRGVQAGRLRRLVIAALVLTAAATVVTHRDLLQRSDGRVYVDSNRDFLASLEADAAILSTWNNSSLFWYLQHVEGVNPGVLVLNARSDHWPRLMTWYGKRPIYLETIPYGMDPNLFEWHHHFLRFRGQLQ